MHAPCLVEVSELGCWLDERCCAGALVGAQVRHIVDVMLR